MAEVLENTLDKQFVDSIFESGMCVMLSCHTISRRYNFILNKQPIAVRKRVTIKDYRVKVNVERLTIKGKKTEVNGRTTIWMVVVLCSLFFLLSYCKITSIFPPPQTDGINEQIDKSYIP